MNTGVFANNSIIDACLQLGGVITAVDDVADDQPVPDAWAPGREEAARAPRGLSTAHISPLGKITFWPGGTLASVTKGDKFPSRGGGPRGKVRFMSRASRRNLLRKIAKTDRAQDPLFITLTYPDIFSEDPAVWKRDIDKFGKRLARRKYGAIWRIEYKERLSGFNVGKIAPHFHLLVWGASYTPKMISWVRRAWFEVVGSGNIDHFTAGTRVEPIHSRRGVMSYTSKYIAKQDEAIVPVGCGRMWGAINRDAIPFVEAIEFEITRGDVFQMFRYLRRYCRMRTRSEVPSMTVFVDRPEAWLSKLDRLLPNFSFA